MTPASHIRAILFKGDGAQNYFAKVLKDRMDKYVPYRGGQLSSNVRVEDNLIIYSQPYAHFQYRGKLYIDPLTGSPFARTGVKKVPTQIPLNYHTPGTGSYWDKKAWTAEKEDILKEVSKYIKRRKNE